MTATGVPSRMPAGLSRRVTVAGCLVVSGLLHAQLYAHGYRAIPVIGPSFLWYSAAAFAVAVLTALADPPVLRLVAAGLAAGSLGGFALSRTVGLFGFVERGWQPAPQALLTVLAEVAVVLLIGLPLAARLRRRPAAATAISA
jgi:hypothetical protein